jgi:ATP-dependent helicase/nuclease subunit A
LWERARRVVAAPALARVFPAGKYLRAANEVAYCARSGDVFRIDRLVEFESEVWVLDYKTGARAEHGRRPHREYGAQVAGYRQP